MSFLTIWLKDPSTRPLVFRGYNGLVLQVSRHPKTGKKRSDFRTIHLPSLAETFLMTVNLSRPYEASDGRLNKGKKTFEYCLYNGRYPWRTLSPTISMCSIRTRKPS